MNHADFRAAGYQGLRLLGSGARGEVWLARELATGDPVVLKRLQPRAEDEDPRLTIAAMHREAAVLSGVEHRHLIRVRRVVGTAEGLILVFDYASGGSLSDLLAARGRLTPGEVVTTAAPLAEALAAAHSQGVRHGDLRPGSILFTAEGRPLLAGLGVAGLVGAGLASGTDGYVDPAAGGVISPATDVFGLAAICYRSLTGVPPDGREHGAIGTGRHAAPGAAASNDASGDSADRCLWPVLRAGLDPDPARRPTAAEFAAALLDSAQPAPVRLALPHLRESRMGSGRDSGATARVRSDPPSRRRVAGRRRRPRSGPSGPGRRRGLGMLLVAAGLLGLLLTVGMHLVGGELMAVASEEAASALSGSTIRSIAVDIAPTDGSWRRTLDRLDLARSEAFANGDESALVAIYASGSPALARDRAQLRQMVSAGARARGLRLRITQIVPVVEDRDRVVLQVTDEITPYVVVDVSGAEIERRPGRGSHSWEVTLMREKGDWRVFDVVGAS